MTQQIPAHPDKKTISDLIGKIKRGELILQPEFQRKFVWTAGHMEQFIKTILAGYPFPEIYISQKGINLETLATQNVVVDGQQRLTTIKKYIEGDGKFEKDIQKYKELTEEQQKDFLNYDVTVRDLKNASPEVIVEIFKRINSTNFTLTKVEMNNAVYDGEFISCAKEILDIIDKQGIKFDIFYDSELTRMADLHFILLVLTTIEEGGYFALDNKVEEYIVLFNDNYPNYEKNKGKLSEIIVAILRSDLSEDSIWFRKSNFFTLVVELYFNNILTIDEKIKEKLMDFERNILENKNANKEADGENSEFAQYYSRMYSGTNSRQARVIRSELFKKYVLSIEK